MTTASSHAWFNGAIGAREASAPSVASISFHLGTGVFDGLMAYWNEDHYYIHRGSEHLARFREGAARMGLNFSWTVPQLLAGIQELLSHEPPGTQYIRPIAYRGAPELWVTGGEGRPVDVSIFTVRVDRDSDATLACHVSPVERISSRAIPGHTKVSGAYVNSFHARRTAEKAGFQDAIMLDREGRITEASAANFFMFADGCLFTPPLNPDVFPGITRQVVRELAAPLDIECIESDITSADLSRARGAFLCSTLMEIRALDRIGERSLPTAQLDAYRELVRSFRAMTHQ